MTSGVAAIAGSTTISLATTGAVQGLSQLQGSTALAFDASATGNLTGYMDGAALIAVSMVAELLGRAALAGTTSITFTGRAVPPLGNAPPDAGVVIVLTQDNQVSVLGSSEVTVSFASDNEVVMAGFAEDHTIG